MVKLNRVNIPTQARVPKPWFSEEPGNAIVAEIKKFVAATSRPYLWRGHTHTKPPQDARVVYVEEFCLPAPYRNNRAFWSPCPCCSDDIPKYKGTDKKPAKIAWFPDEKVIRLIGHDCFSSLNKIGHEDALRDLRSRQNRQRHERFLIENLGLASEALIVIEHNLAIAVAFDEFRRLLLSKLQSLRNFRLAESIRGGKLQIIAKVTKTIVDKNKKERRVTKVTHKTYAEIPGYEFFELHRKNVAPKFHQAQAFLTKVDASLDVTRATDLAITATSKNFAKGLKLAKEAGFDLEVLRRFVSKQVINTLRTWGRREDSVLRFEIELTDDSLYIGPTRDQKIRIPVPGILLESLSIVPVPGAGQSVDVIAREAG